jgi:hypothetical protein
VSISNIFSKISSLPLQASSVSLGFFPSGKQHIRKLQSNLERMKTPQGMVAALPVEGSQIPKIEFDASSAFRTFVDADGVSVLKFAY